MGLYAPLAIVAGLLAAGPAAAPSDDAAHLDAAHDPAADEAAEPEGGTGVSPVELVPRIELRQSYLNLSGGMAEHDTTPEIDIQFFRRLLLRYQVPFRRLNTPDGEVSGLGDVQLQALGILYSDAQRLVGAIAGAQLDTASQPQLGAGKQQVVLGGGGALKPRRWLLAYLIAQDQFSVGGKSGRADVNQLEVRLGGIVFGKQYNWFKVDLDTTVDFPQNAGRFFGTVEVGSLVVGRVGLFIRGGTQFLGPPLLDYSVAAGVRYLFRLGTSRPKPQ